MASNHYSLTQSDRDTLVECLEECRSLRQQAERSEIIERLPAEIKRQFHERGSLRVRITNIVNVCADYPGGIEMLREAVRRFEGNSYAMGRVDEFIQTKEAQRKRDVTASSAALTAPNRRIDGSTKSIKKWLLAVVIVSASAALIWLAAATLRLDENARNKTATSAVDAHVALADTAPMRFVRIAGDAFTMGTPTTEETRLDDESPLHRVRLFPFDIAVHEVTQKQWISVMGDNPSLCKYGCGDDFPVQNITWNDAIEFLNRLSNLEHLTQCYRVSKQSVTWNRSCDGYRLPTEAEWEYVCRAGTSMVFGVMSDSAELPEYAWFADNSLGDARRVHPVGSRRANPLGVHDLQGNVWEWTWDWYASYAAESITVTTENPAGPDSDHASVVETPGTDGKKLHTKARVIRGGSFWQKKRQLRCGYRFRLAVTYRDEGTGLRVVRHVPHQDAAK